MSEAHESKITGVSGRGARGPKRKIPGSVANSFARSTLRHAAGQKVWWFHQAISPEWADVVINCWRHGRQADRRCGLAERIIWWTEMDAECERVWRQRETGKWRAEKEMLRGESRLNAIQLRWMAARGCLSCISVFLCHSSSSASLYIIICILSKVVWCCFGRKAFQTQTGSVWLPEVAGFVMSCTRTSVQTYLPKM